MQKTSGNTDFNNKVNEFYKIFMHVIYIYIMGAYINLNLQQLQNIHSYPEYLEYLLKFILGHKKMLQQISKDLNHAG